MGFDDVARDLVHAPKHTATGSTSPPPWANGPTAPGPASESRQRTTPRGVGHPVDQQAIWGIERGVGLKENDAKRSSPWLWPEAWVCLQG